MNSFKPKTPSPLITYRRVLTAFGRIKIGIFEGKLCSLVFESAGEKPAAKQAIRSTPSEPDEILLNQIVTQLSEYAAGKRTYFEIPLIFLEGTDFQKNVWKTLQTIPYGKTESYQSIAAKVGNTKAVRAVGGANGKNPIPLIVPCHRVIRADGSLGGYSLGLELKRKLLELESRTR